MGEEAGEVARRKYSPTCSVNIARFGSTPYGVNCRALRPQNRGVDAAVTPTRLAEVQGARHVRRITTEYSTEIEDYPLPFLQGFGGGAGVGVGSSRSRCDNGLECRPFCALFPHSVLDLRCEFALLRSRLNEGQEIGENLGGNAPGIADAVDLPSILHFSEFLDYIERRIAEVEQRT
jgi:hypothetical protein